MEQPDYISGILGGDRGILRQLYAVHFPVIFSLIRDHGGSEADAKDIFQDALLLIYKKAQQADFQLSSQFGTFLYGICRNLWFNRRNKKFATSEVTLSEDVKYIADDSSLESELLYVEQGNLFWRAFSQLGEDCRKLLELFFQKKSMETIAAQMGYGSEGYAKRRKLQCKDRKDLA